MLHGWCIFDSPVGIPIRILQSIQGHPILQYDYEYEYSCELYSCTVSGYLYSRAADFVALPWQRAVPRGCG